MDYCKHCKYQIYSQFKDLHVFSLCGQKININTKMYCSKECFITKNMFTERFQIFENSYNNNKNMRNIDFREK